MRPQRIEAQLRCGAPVLAPHRSTAGGNLWGLCRPRGVQVVPALAVAGR